MWCLAGVLQNQEDFTILYADDVLIGANSEEELKLNVRAVLGALLTAGFRVSAKKCSFTPAREITYLGWIIGDGKVRASPSALDKLWKIRKPDEMCTLKDDKAKINCVRRFLGVLQYLGHYIPCAAEELRPLYELTKTSPGTGSGQDYVPPPPIKEHREHRGGAVPQRCRPFKWTDEANTAWDWAVARMREIQPLNTPTYAPGSYLETLSDASKYGWGEFCLNSGRATQSPTWWPA